MLERIRAAEARRQRGLRSRRDHDAETASLAQEIVVHVIRAIAQRDLRGADVVENLRVGPRVRQRAVRNRVAAPRHGIRRDGYLQDAAA